MVDLRYECPKTANEVIKLLSVKDEITMVFAGGTDLLVQMQEEAIEPTILVDIKKIEETRLITVTKEKIEIGSAVTGAEIGENSELKALWPGVVEALELIGSYQIQGRATIGGNLCNASPAADSVPALIAAGAKLKIAGPNGLREIGVETFPVAPGQTSLKKGEFVISVVLEIPPELSGHAYLRFIPRTEMDIAVVGAGAYIELNRKGICKDARLALGAVSSTSKLVKRAPEILIGEKLEAPILEKLAEVARDACSPINDKRGTIEFRKKVAGVLACRATKIAWSRTERKP